MYILLLIKITVCLCVTEYDHSGVLCTVAKGYELLRTSVHTWIASTTVFKSMVIFLKTTVSHVTEVQYWTYSNLLDGILAEFAVNHPCRTVVCTSSRAYDHSGLWGTVRPVVPLGTVRCTVPPVHTYFSWALDCTRCTAVHVVSGYLYCMIYCGLQFGVGRWTYKSRLIMRNPL